MKVNKKDITSSEEIEKVLIEGKEDKLIIQFKKHTLLALIF